MRWFVEVSRVGENSSDEKYCVEAKQWQAALQEARKLRGDSGPLSKFSIELLDDGYRAVDPKLKLRFVVAKAPPNAELSTESSVAPHLNGQASPAPSVSPPSVSTSWPASAPAIAAPVASPAVAPSTPLSAAPVPAPPPLISSPLPAGGAPSMPVEPHTGVPSSALSPLAPPVGRAGPSVSPAEAAAASPLLGTKSSVSAFPPRPPLSGRPQSARPPAGITVPADKIPAAPAVPQGLGPPVAPPQSFTQPSPAIDAPPPSSVLRKRQEDPTPESPITYREVAYVVEPGVSRASVEALLRASFRELSRELADRIGQKFVQLAVFDHKFDRKPERAPLGTLAWKDWRGNPVLTFPLFDGTAPARASMPPAAPTIKPIPVVKISSSAPPVPSLRAPVPSPASVPAAAPASVPAAAAPAPAAPASVPAAAPVAAPAPSAAVVAADAAPAAPVVVAVPAAPESSAPAAPLVVAATPSAPAAPEAKSDAQAVAIPLTREKQPSHPSATRSSKPRLPAIQRRAGEDLIGELFETMHDLHFMRGVADGAEFVLAAVESIVPCDGVLVHVFDINTRQFVVVRARGPGTMQALLHRTPDTEPFFNAVMRRPGSVAIHDVGSDARVLGPRWDLLGVKPRRALCGPVRQGGRYLGLLEVVNPLGDAPFHQTEQNAIDYVCEQFAQFLANRPIVLDEDVILRR